MAAAALAARIAAQTACELNVQNAERRHHLPGPKLNFALGGEHKGNDPKIYQHQMIPLLLQPSHLIRNWRDFWLASRTSRPVLWAFAQCRTFFALNRTLLPKIAPVLSRIGLRLGSIKACPTTGARSKGPYVDSAWVWARSRVAKSGPVGFAPQGPKPNRLRV